MQSLLENFFSYFPKVKMISICRSFYKWNKIAGHTAPVWSNAGTDFRSGVNLLIALPFGPITRFLTPSNKTL